MALYRKKIGSFEAKEIKCIDPDGWVTYTDNHRERFESDADGAYFMWNGVHRYLFVGDWVVSSHTEFLGSDCTRYSYPAQQFRMMFEPVNRLDIPPLTESVN
jgi:hypothetical protein